MQQQDRLLNLWLNEQVEQDKFPAKQTELRDRNSRDDWTRFLIRDRDSIYGDVAKNGIKNLGIQAVVTISLSKNTYEG